MRLVMGVLAAAGDDPESGLVAAAVLGAIGGAAIAIVAVLHGMERRRMVEHERELEAVWSVLAASGPASTQSVATLAHIERDRAEQLLWELHRCGDVMREVEVTYDDRRYDYWMVRNPAVLRRPRKK